MLWVILNRCQENFIKLCNWQSAKNIEPLFEWRHSSVGCLITMCIWDVGYCKGWLGDVSGGYGGNVCCFSQTMSPVVLVLRVHLHLFPQMTVWFYNWQADRLMLLTWYHFSYKYIYIPTYMHVVCVRVLYKPVQLGTIVTRNPNL